ncbi:hybrid sensor histidine kinase/response regulator [Pseudomonas daroniae]|uniref:histidine kinase n=1 Tax=Phytopseudomonas daroniae TaxID=2487519 RepID=A0A4Q9QK78_9GAMM|nr:MULTISPECIES: ATP-binding protein [Pseudomonas]TBU76543.1 hybrid sensor histidine kinase/response regulator [Pseudomonas daroniae]TBU80912.1 hybrid sensor histidine kinase/response regulator [Pseudomonas sp. FRB 228]TBU90150.1 hybrid sensor histidine kinase/response regulator [Pseudomonas daroniae]
MFKDIGIKGRVLMLTLLPTSLLALVLGGYFIWMQLSGLQAQLLQRGHMIAEQLAPLAAPALLHGNKSLLQRIATEALEQPDVRAVSFLAMQNDRLAHAGPSMLNERPTVDSDTVDVAQHSSQDATRFLLPVMAQHLTLSEEEQFSSGTGPIGWVELELSHHNTLLSGYRSLLTSLLLVVTGLIITGLLALRMSRSINDPLLRIKHGVALLKDGHLETRLPPLGSHELDELASGINRMAESLQNAQEEMQHSIDQVTEDLRQNLETIEIQNIELDFARKEALEASRIKSEFLANMSHEIRTPLNGILGFTNLLQKSELSPRQQDYLGTIEKSADSLLGIINEVLDFSKIEAGKLVLENIPFNLRDVLQDTLTILAPSAHEKQLELLSLVYRDTPVSLSGDPLRLKQVLTNLVSNAIKFTREGSIVIRAMLEEETADRAQLRISVRDTGIGLAEEDLRALFQAFSQADNSMSRQAGGTGLGLVISKRLIEQMGGEIGVDSTPGEGSEFWVSLSLPKARSDAEDQPRALSGRRAAILEAHELACQALQHQLEDCGLQVSVFSDLNALCEAASTASRSAQPFNCAVLGVTASHLPPEQLGKRIWDLEHLGCKTVVLCPTTEQAQYQDCVPDWHSQLQAKPACTRKLQRTLTELIVPKQIRQQVRHSTTRSPAILCVDDNAANLLLVQTLLDSMGAQVTIASSGFDALAITREQDFDLVFMDVQMPGMDGRQTTEAIRQWEHDSARTPMPIVALTAHALANEKRTLLQSGMDDYLTKPISERQLAQVVLKWTGLALQGANQDHPASTELPTAVLDNEEGLRLAAGKADLAADMLSMLLAGLPSDLQAVRQARADGDRNALIERIHRLHGATRYCGVPQLRAACQHSETQLKQDQPLHSSGLDELEQAIERLDQLARSGPAHTMG